MRQWDKPAIFFIFAVFTFFIFALSRINHWWFDELWSILCSDPSFNLSDIYRERIITDSNPPLYYTLLYLSRGFIRDARLASIAVNGVALAISATVVLATAMRRNMMGVAMLALTVFFLSGPALVYFVEARSYFLALSVAFVASWLGVLALEFPHRQPGTALLALTGLMAALIHPFAALYCCCLCVGLTTVSAMDRRPELLRSGLALSLPALAATAIWAPYGFAAAGKIAWISRTFRNIGVEFWKFFEITLGQLMFLQMAVVAYFLVNKIKYDRRRSLSFLFIPTLGLFIIIPLLIYPFLPLIVARYLIIGAPGFYIYFLFLMREMSASVFRETPGSAMGPRAVFSLSFRDAEQRLWIVGAVCLATITAGGFPEAWNWVRHHKEEWTGAKIVVPLLGGCLPGAIHVNQRPELFAFVSGSPAAIFVDVVHAVAPGSGGQVPAGAGCAILGWAEHTTQRGPSIVAASDARLLAYLKIDADASQTVILRHRYGFVVLRRPRIVPPGRIS